MGFGAGETNQGGNSVAIGLFAGQNTQSGNSVAIGQSAGSTNQQSNSVAIGAGAGESGLGAFFVALGCNAGPSGQHANTTVINSSGTALGSDRTKALFVAPIRQAGATFQLFYNQTTKEITYN